MARSVAIGRLFEFYGLSQMEFGIHFRARYTVLFFFFLRRGVAPSTMNRCFPLCIAVFLLAFLLVFSGVKYAGKISSR